MTGSPGAGSSASAHVRTWHGAPVDNSAQVRAGKTASPAAGSSASASADRSHRAAAADSSARVHDRRTASPAADSLAEASARLSPLAFADSSALAHADTTACLAGDTTAWLGAASACDRTTETTAPAAASLYCRSLAAAADADTPAGAIAGTSLLVDADKRRIRRDRIADPASSDLHRGAQRFRCLAQSGRHRCMSRRPTCGTMHRYEERRILARPIRRLRDPCWSRSRACLRQRQAARGTRVRCCRASRCRRAGPRAIRSGSPRHRLRHTRFARRTRFGLPRPRFAARRCHRADACRDCCRRIRTGRDPRRSRRARIHAARRRAAAARRVRSPVPSIDRPPHGGRRRRRG